MADRLETLQTKLDDLTDPDGEYAVVCPLSGKRPVPVRGTSFPTPDAAESAADLVVAYRKLLREVDPHLENLPVAACAQSAEPLALDASGRRAGRDRASRDHAGRGPRDDGGGTAARASDGDDPATVTLSGAGDDEWLRLTDAPVVRVRADGQPLDDAVVGLELNAKL